MAGDEVIGVSQWLYSTLHADTTLASLVSTRIYDDYAPETASFPYILYTFSGGSDTVGVAASRIFVRGFWIVKAVDQSSSFSTVQTIAQRIDAVLQKKSGTGGSTTIYSCSRTMPYRAATVDTGISYRELGGLYRIVAQ